MFWLGAAAGAADEVKAGQERARQRMERQLEEAKAYAQVAQKRRAEADGVKTQIKQMSASYGVSEKTLFSAYKNGNLEQLSKIYQTAQERNGNLSPEVLESLYTVPAGMESDDIQGELNRIFGIVEQGVREEPQVDDASFSKLLFRAIGGDYTGAAEDALYGQTVQGYDVPTLLNMPLPVSPTADGGKINYDTAVVLDPPSGAEKDPSDVLMDERERQEAKSLTDALTARVMTQGAGKYNLTSYQDRIATAINRRVTREMLAGRDSGQYPTEETIDLSGIVEPAQVEGQFLIQGLDENTFEVVDGSTGMSVGSAPKQLSTKKGDSGPLIGFEMNDEGIMVPVYLINGNKVRARKNGESRVGAGPTGGSGAATGTTEPAFEDPTGLIPR